MRDPYRSEIQGYITKEDKFLDDLRALSLESDQVRAFFQMHDRDGMPLTEMLAGLSINLATENIWLKRQLHKQITETCTPVMYVKDKP